ncbi:MAG: hypothetical protein SF053_05110 [Bacteroidia bacterium]|nr:hypothetical protein [Bacteroidia bacterium]
MRILLTVVLVSVLGACMAQTPIYNPPAPGFREGQSDPRAIRIADEVMEAMGGRRAWDSVACIQWTFFGFRTLTWDKAHNRCRIEIPRDSMVMEVNLGDLTGTVTQRGKAMTEADSLQKYLTRARSIWINDSYWLVMPFKLKDSGVALKYVGEGATAEGTPADILEMTFEGVGDTPDNKYHIWVDKTSRLVIQWAYFAKYTDTEPRIQNPWTDYRPYGGVLLSGGRGNRGMENISLCEGR